jgi:hypothetical protein
LKNSITYLQNACKYVVTPWGNVMLGMSKHHYDNVDGDAALVRVSPVPLTLTMSGKTSTYKINVARLSYARKNCHSKGMNSMT